MSTKDVPVNSELHRKLMKAIQPRLQYGLKEQQKRHSIWKQGEEQVLAYVPESEVDSKRRNRRENGEPVYTTIQLPYTYALLMAAHTYWTSVFFGRAPVHQYAGRHGETEQQVQALEALVGYQVEVGEIMGPYYLWLYDIGKYGVGVLEEYWCKEEIAWASIEETEDPLTGKKMKQQVRVRAPGYQGTKCCNISPFDFIPDPRVPVGQFQKGEFCGVRKRLSWNDVVRREKQGYYMNVDRLRPSEGRRDPFHGTSGSSQLERPEDNQSFFSTGETTHPSIVPVYEFHCELIPDEWGIGDSDFPEKWVFTVTQDYSTIIGAQPSGYMHGRFPFTVGEYEIEAYGTWNRGIPEIALPLQNTMDWLINQHFFNVRAALNNQFILDPSKIIAEDAEDGGPGFIFRLRPNAYGTDIKQFFHQIPVQDVTRGHVADVQQMLSFGERVFGVNEQIFGVMAGGGRKTATEVRTSTGFGVNRLKTVTEYLSATSFSPHSQRLVQNSQQLFDAPRKMRIVGSLLQDMGPNAAERFMMVSPEEIQGFFNFLPVDGNLPVDRLAMANMWKEILIQMRNVPGLLMRYDLGKIFAHVATLAGVRNLEQFKIEVGSPVALAQQAEAGNVIPLGGGASKGGGQKASGVPASSPVMPPAPAIPPQILRPQGG